MKRIMPFLLSISLVALLGFANAGMAAGNLSTTNNTVQLPDTTISQMIGGGWGDYVQGFACGAGIVITAATVPAVFTGVGALIWYGEVVGTIAACSL
jgi:hypothetical protein